jgi:germination protein M
VTVYALVNTLCELSNINRVQITVDGEAQEKYGEMEHFDTVLERNLDLVEGGNE